MEHYSALKRNAKLVHIINYMNLQRITLSEKVNFQEIMGYIILFIKYFWNAKILEIKNR